MKNFAFTCGDINGIGPEITIKTFNNIPKSSYNKILFFCPANVFEAGYKRFEGNFEYKIINGSELDNYRDSGIYLVDIGSAEIQYGEPTSISGNICYKSILEAFEATSGGYTEAIITAPISKTALKLAGINFPGHTEMLAEFCKVKKFVMMFLSDDMIAAMFTIHESIRNVPDLITSERVNNVIEVVETTLKNDLGINSPKIAVLGLNPHAGEEGKIGNEEIEVIKPALNLFNSSTISGPYVPDAFFGNRSHNNFDAVVGMYHDQILIPFKLLAFEKGVNYTAGLPIVRTSPDHGTAFDIAGKNLASPVSTIEAFKWANIILKNRAILDEG